MTNKRVRQGLILLTRGRYQTDAPASVARWTESLNGHAIRYLTHDLSVQPGELEPGYGEESPEQPGCQPNDTAQTGQKRMGGESSKADVVSASLFVRAARLEYSRGALLDALDACQQQGCDHIAVWPLFYPLETGLRHWLERVLLRWRHGTPTGSPISLQLLPALLDTLPLTELLPQRLPALLAQTDVLVPMTQTPPTQPASWSKIPAYRYHILTCQGPRCTAEGAGNVWHYLAQRLKQEKLVEVEQGTLTVSTGCLYPCNHAPVLVIHPDNIWYRVPDEQAVDSIITQHIRGGQPVCEYRISSQS